MNSVLLLQGLLLLTLGICGISEDAPSCGKPRVFSKRVVGGHATKNGKWPWQAIVVIPNQFISGATLVSNKWVVSAAHWLESEEPGNVDVILGAFNIVQDHDEHSPIKAKQIIIHPDYSPSTLLADICLIELSESVSYTIHILPICLPAPSMAFPSGTRCWTTGWGDVEYGGYQPRPNTLQEVELQLFSDQQCKNAYFSEIQPDMICAGDSSGGKDSCQGDGGGPLVCSAGGQWYLVGVIIFGTGCGRKDYPGVYTSVAPHTEWIEKSISSGSAQLGSAPGWAGVRLCSYWLTLGDLWILLLIMRAVL
ncbi:serine protease 33 [Xenopus tropicalis]|uniref:Serine protease 33 n=2 Tax=Xenopus tropicalis TaxID=8364 RepID=A0A803KG87_XENTR|nr:serine protease 33 [Xenopus tropicalis]